MIRTQIYLDEALLNNLDAIFGLWKNKRIDTDQYIRNLRRDRKK